MIVLHGLGDGTGRVMPGRIGKRKGCERWNEAPQSLQVQKHQMSREVPKIG
jgi:hypothetical protein